MKKQIIDTLEEYGLNDKESKVYLGLLEMGISSVEDLSEITKIARSTIYDVIRVLKQNGLVNYVIKNNVRFFEASDPDRFLETLEEKKKKMREILPELKLMKKTTIKKPSFNFYEGEEGLKTVLQNVLKTNKEILIIGNHSNFINHLKWTGEAFTKTRATKKIPVRFIGEISEETQELLKRDKNELRKTKILKELNNIKSEIHLSGSKAVLITLKESQPIGMIIEDEELVELFKVVFELVWKNADK